MSEWIRSYFIVSFVLMIVSYLSPGEKYKEYYKFFTGLLLALLLVVPMLNVFAREDYKVCWEGWDEVEKKLGDISFEGGDVDFEGILSGRLEEEGFVP